MVDDPLTNKTIASAFGIGASCIGIASGRVDQETSSIPPGASVSLRNDGYLAQHCVVLSFLLQCVHISRRKDQQSGTELIHV